MGASSTEQLIAAELGEADPPSDNNEAPPAYSQREPSPTDSAGLQQAPLIPVPATPPQAPLIPVPATPPQAPLIPVPATPPQQPGTHPPPSSADRPPMVPAAGSRPGSAAMPVGNTTGSPAGSRSGSGVPPSVSRLRPQSAGSQTSRPGSGSQRGTPQPEEELMRSTPLPGQVQVDVVELGEPVDESQVWGSWAPFQ